MIGRRQQPVRRTADGFVIELPDEQRHLLRRLIGELDQLLESESADDAKMRRLFPPAYTDEPAHDAEYQRLMRDEQIGRAHV